MIARLVIVLLLFLGTGLADYAFSRPESEQNRLPLSDFPKSIGDWTFVGGQSIDEGSMAILQVDDYIMRSYRNSKGETIGLYIGYFRNQREGKQVHSPRQCLPGAGWNILEAKEVRIPTGENGGRDAIANIFVMGKGSVREIYLWWYQGRGRVYANEYMNKLYLILDAIVKGRTDGALVRINMVIKQDVEDTVKEEVGFTSRIHPLLGKYVPD